MNKRLLFLSASVAAMSVLMTACDDKDENKEFDSSQECTSYNGGSCTKVMNPVKLTELNAPRFRTIQECEDKFGQGNCAIPIPKSGKISAVFGTLEACELVYGEDQCVFKTLPVAEDDERGNSRTTGWVWSGMVNPETGVVTGAVSSGYGGGGSHGGTVVYRPIVTPYSYYYPFTYGYWGGSPWHTTPPSRIGGYYFTSSRGAATHPGTTGSYKGSPTSNYRSGIGPNPGPGVGSSKAGTVGSVSGSKGSGFGSTGSGASS